MEFTAYFDDSGHPSEGPQFVVAGFLSTNDRWARLQVEWNDTLALFELKGFHMKDYAACRGEFRAWKGNDRRREALLKRLIRIARRNVMASISSAILMNEYRAVDQIFELSEFVSPYPICGVNAQHKAISWLKEHQLPVDEISFVYENGSKHKGEFIKLSTHLGFPKPSFEPKHKSRGLELADFIAWELGKVIRDVSAERYYIRTSLRELRRNLPRMWGIYRESDLINFCVAQKLERRRSS